MKLYYKVPFYDNSDFMGHLIEHVILYPDQNNVKQCGITPRVSGSLQGERTRIDFDHLEDKKVIFDLLHKPISQKVVDYEYKIFNEEFAGISYVSRVLEKCNKMFLGEERSKKPRPFSLDEIQAYHDKHIIQGNYVLIDNDTNKVIEHNFNESKLQKLDLYSIPELEYHLVYLEGQKNYIVIHKGSQVNALVFLYFLYDVIKAWDFYSKRYTLESYYTHGPSDYYSTGVCGMRISPHCNLDITEDFFNFQKNYFLRELIVNKYPSIIAFSMLFNNQKYELNKALELIESMQFSDYITIIGNIKNIS
ncbi:MAG TPA: hypothetical protein PLW93_01010 [Candidatus Absconditabacterales bacterium]|nr:hypothetical protein [Candidatus Absconditabacterales bacterium]HNG96831.1 hypothetical protein [Candidatus Absconditabacterales bacterium]